MNLAVAQILMQLASKGGKVGTAANAYMQVNKWKEVFDSVSSDAKRMFDALSSQWIEMQDIAFQTGRSMAMSREMAMRYDRQLMQTTKELARQYGITAKEIADFQKSYAESTGRNVMLTRKQTEAMAAMHKIAGENASVLIDEFDKVGVGIERATAYTGRFQERAKALGVSPAKASKTLADNIRLAASYSFKNGVADIEKMALRATSIRMDMDAVMTAAGNFSDIEKAIGNSAKIQMLGGSFAQQFSNPMGAMYESMADPEAFMRRIERTIEGKGRYDKKTGQVTFDPVTMMQMKAMAEALGVTVDKLTTPAMAKVQEGKVKEELQAAGTWDNWSKAERAAIMNLSRNNVDETTGKHQITYTDVNGELQTKAIEDLTHEELQIAQDRQMDEKGLFSDVQDIKDILERTLGRARGTTSTKENLTGFKEEINSFIAQFQNAYMGMVSGGLNGQNFRPWDWIKTLSWPTGQMDIGTHASEGLWDNFFSWTGPYGFEQGGIVEPVQHAALGTIVKGDSYTGDRTPVMANAGEMILNKGEQKGLFDLLKNIAMTGLMAYGGNKFGRHFGMNGLGTNMALSNLLSGGQMGAGSMLGIGAGMYMNSRMMGGPMGMMPMRMGINTMGRTITMMNPTVMMNGQTIMNGSIGDGTLVEQLEDVADAATVASRSTRSFSARLMSLARKRTLMGSVTRGLLHADRSRRRLGAKISNGWAGHFYRNRVAEVKLGKAYAADWLSNTKLARGARNFRTDIKSLFASTNSLKDARKSNAIAKSATEATKVASSAGKVGKVMSGIGNAGKFLGMAAGPIGAALAIGGAIGNISAASSQYDARVSEIESSGMSDMEKARAKDRAAKEKNAGIGGSVGSAVGATAGAALGSVFGPLGMIAGGWLGEKAGNFIGKGIGSLFGGGEEKKLKKEQEEKIKAETKGAEAKAKSLTSIEKNVEKIAGGRVSSIGARALKSPSIKDIGLSALKMIPGVGAVASVISAMPTDGNPMKVKPSYSDNDSKPRNITPKEIKLNISGTIKLEGNGATADLDIRKLIENPAFKRQLAEIINKETNITTNAGKEKKEFENSKVQRNNGNGKG